MTYHLFLASSIRELEHDRNAIGNFVRKVNDALRELPGDNYLQLFICELEDATMSVEGKQAQYNRHLEKCHLFLNLYGQKAGEFTLQELSAARAARERTGKPELLIFFRETLQPHESIQILRTELQESNIPYQTYGDTQDVKLALLQWLQKTDPSLPITTDEYSGKIGNCTVLK